ncbi:MULTISPECIES: sugar transferase [Butyricimonas]|jgi:undecaprenyl-phosphate galactose phosphotransferase|uniref:Lipopolysaccharide/colanic/teichoic acid biosynthesis glycosyltransferase n=1 Tax=Butyricimonas paravirosa TaxID=1472417 RepID=A0A7X5Y8Q4_9BACT|nr:MULTISPECIES: sugar transferase [Odoribacteraceae]MBS7197132.1 sugar transferase [Bacteroidales bacterium]NJC16610.1 lipopolysaccharide/colanic/teichoic acid biosynthesis glycosyltransferase [Butyricimonas paravirosa]RGG49481.1 sugar transferase [Odoribacter sp. AF21-41]RHH94577.1 sugar transferase [Odoribacter sp. AM16-33]WOF12903.1 sugar transferase [Butyricimonas paravirosa]
MYKCFFKRFFDIIIALLFLPFILFVFVVIAPIIYFTDKGPVFYNAKRAGKRAKPFKMFKFRSMYVNSPDLRNADGSTYNGEDDPRVTRIGKILRKTSLDELPQLLNVLLGDMSFVGPRPTLATKTWDELDDVRKKRASIRPGITGYSQAYYRNSITQDEKFAYDAYYVEHMSLWLDVKILLQTVISVIKRDHIFVQQK